MDIEQLAETMQNEFLSAAKAIKKAHIAAVDNVASAIAQAEEARNAGLAEVRKMQEEAARMAAESLRRGEEVEATYREAMRAAVSDLNDMRGPQAIGGRARVRSIAGGKAAE